MRLNFMSRAPLRTSRTADPPLPSVRATQPPVTSEPAEPRCLAELIAERDAFAAEVSRELASIRSLLSSLSIGKYREASEHDASRHEDSRHIAAQHNFESEIATGSKSATKSATETALPSWLPEENPIVPLLKPEGVQRPSQQAPSRFTSEAATSPSVAEADRSGPDRLAALKERIAAKLRAETGTPPPSFRPEETNGSVTAEGTEKANEPDETNAHPRTAEALQP